MKYLLLLHNNPEFIRSLPAETMARIEKGHGDFIETVRASGELIVTQALADASTSRVVRVADGNRVAMIPDAGVEGLAVEVRAVMFSSGADV